nr:MAG TPA: hypothetical protein [Caudoviricetes sp.]
MAASVLTFNWLFYLRGYLPAPHYNSFKFF